jgi:hypothetical protein
MSDNENYMFKKGIINFIDIGIAIMNFTVIAFTLIYFYRNIIISIIGVIFATILMGITVLTFIKDNPFYIYYCYALIITSLFFLFRLMLINSLFGFIILPTVWDIYTFYTANQMYSPNLVPYDNSVSLYSTGIPKRTDSNIAYKRKQRVELIKKQYNSNISRKYSLILTMSLILIFIIYILI